MAIQMILCPACKKKVSIEAQACPHCGQPITDETRAEGVKRSKRRRWGCLTVILIFAGIVWFGESARKASPLPGTGDHQSESLAIPKPKQELDVKTTVQDTFREFIVLDHISATEMKEAGEIAGKLGKGATIKKLRDELKDVQLAAQACYGSINDITIPDSLPENIKKHIVDGRNDFLMAAHLREKMANIFIDWLNTGENSLPQDVQNTSNMISMALLSGMSSYTAAMSLSGFSEDEIQAELEFVGGKQKGTNQPGSEDVSPSKP